MTKEFCEVQRFPQRWLWAILVINMLVLVGIFGYGFIGQLLFGRPWGDRPVSNNTLLIIGGVIIVFSLALICVFYALRLVTETREEGLFVRFYPIRGKIIPYQVITFCRARTCNPLSEYGGWGLKYGRSGWAYNIAGHQGVQLELVDDKRVLIGSQRAAELKAVINTRCNRDS